jgi:endonuclease YncB( thermonuclease family)
LSRFVVLCTANGIDVNEWVVRQGWAVASRRFGDDYVDAEAEARAACRGLWASDFVRPDQPPRHKRAKPDWVRTECALPKQ